MKTVRWLLRLLLASMTFQGAAEAATTIIPKNPKDLCGRFIAPDSQTECAKKVKKIEPDWYLATICDQQFDDSDFWSCLELSRKSNFSPEKLETCNREGISDHERMSCVQKLAKDSPKETGFQQTQIKPNTQKTKKQ